MTTPTLYLIPVPLSESPLSTVIPDENIRLLKPLRYFIVENIRSARRFLRSADAAFDIDGATFYELNKHTDPQSIASFLQPMAEGHDMGVISEAGCPAIADPGADVVAIAQERGYNVHPLVGPSSILLSLMASGFNGQGFTFHGYLPIEASVRATAIKEMERAATTPGYTQIFIETPYRNAKLIDDLCRLCRPETKLCIAAGITSPEALIRTQTIRQWQKRQPNIQKVPTIFLLGR